MGDDKQPLTAEQVAAFLIEQPDFFQQNPTVFESLELNSVPEGTISLAQRQVESLRKKSRQLEQQLALLLDNAHSNSELQDRVHRLCLSLMDADTLPSLLTHLVAELKQEFSAEFVAIRLFSTKKMHFDLEGLEENISQMAIDDADLIEFDSVLSKHKPVCGRLTKAQKKILFNDEAKNVESAACLPLGENASLGLLAIASTDPNRFHSDMGTIYLAFLGEVFIRLIQQHNK